MLKRKMTISDVRFTSAGHFEVESGLLGWVQCTLNGSLQLDGLMLRRTREGRLTISFPARQDGSNRQHFYFRPLDNDTRLEIEQQIFKALGFEEEAA